jgi:hypothetical protein
MAMTGEEREVRLLFQSLRSGSLDSATKHDIARKICQLISDKGYRDGEIHSLVHGGLIDSLDSLQPTGIFKIPPLKELFVKYSEIDWELLTEYGEGIGSTRFLYIGKVIQQAFQRKTWGPPFQNSTKIQVLHLSTYEKIPLYSEARSAGIEVETQTSYGVPAIYVSHLSPSGTQEISECSEDLVIDREEKNLEYNRGILFEIDSTAGQIFYIDRKANIAYQNHFIRKALLVPEFSDLAPSEQTLTEFVAAINYLLSGWKETTKPHDKVALATQTAAALSFSIVGFCLFELIHEYLAQFTSDINWINSAIRELDPRQRVTWSMRGFTIPSVEKLEKFFHTHEHILGKDSFREFCNYFDREFRYRLFGFIGDDKKFLKECAFNNRFHAPLHEMEQERGVVDLRREPYPRELVLGTDSELHGAVMIDRQRFDLVFQRAQLSVEQKRALEKLSSDPCWKEAAIKALRNQRLKCAYFHAKESLGAHTIKLMLANNVGCLAVPFQPDSRGELLLTPLATPANTQMFRVRVEKKQERDHVVKEGSPLKFAIGIRDFSSFDPLLRYAYDKLYTSALPTHSKSYGDVRTEVTALIHASIPRLDASIPEAAEVVAVVIPFFKEKDSYVHIVLDTLKAFDQRHEFLLFILVSNQAPDVFMHNIAALEARLPARAKGRYLIFPVNTSEVGRINYWMIEKYLNVHLGSFVVTHLRPGALKYAIYLEGDISHTAEWWKAVHSITTPLPEVVIFQFQVGVRPEGEQSPPKADFYGSDAILAKLFSTPATSVVLGQPVEQIFGGNFILGPTAAFRFCNYLEASEHVESLVETWLPVVMLEATSARILRVAPKIHLPALVEHHFSTDSKFVKWVWDLFYSLEQFSKVSQGRLLTAVVDDAPEYVFEKESIEAWERRREESLRIYDYSRQVYREVLTPKLDRLYELAATKIRGAKPNRPYKSQIDFDTWTETVIRFFLSTRDRRVDASEEILFGLKALYSFNLLFYAGTDYKIQSPVPSPKKADELRALIGLTSRR